MFYLYYSEHIIYLCSRIKIHLNYEDEKRIHFTLNSSVAYRVRKYSKRKFTKYGWRISF